jgi:hypothetical protein
MENIIIIDNFLDEIKLNELLKSINEKKFRYGHGSGYNEIINNKFFVNNDLELFFIDYIKENVENYFSKKYKLNRNYMHIQSFGQDGAYHIDDSELNTYTFCLYISEINDLDLEHANGEFLIKIPNEKHIVCIDTLMNRGLFFPSHYYHKGMAYNRMFSNKRLCLTLKLELIE